MTDSTPGSRPDEEPVQQPNQQTEDGAPAPGRPHQVPQARLMRLEGTGTLIVPASAATAAVPSLSADGPTDETTRQILAAMAAVQEQVPEGAVWPEFVVTQQDQVVLAEESGGRFQVDWRTPAQRGCEGFQRPDYSQLHVIGRWRHTEFTDLDDTVVTVSGSSAALVDAVRLYLSPPEREVEQIGQQYGLSAHDVRMIISMSTGAHLCRAMAAELHHALGEFLATGAGRELACERRHWRWARVSWWRRLRVWWMFRRAVRQQRKGQG